VGRVRQYKQHDYNTDAVVIDAPAAPHRHPGHQHQARGSEGRDLGRVPRTRTDRVLGQPVVGSS
jgi:hypothetical protein